MMERLQKLLAQAGVASRRRAEEMITAGRVRVNGKVVQELGAQADPENDTILVDNHPVAIESKAYYILNKPRGYISDRDDTAENKTALDLVPDGRRLFSAGRLDLMSEGMLLLTNDGELANKLTHPRYEHEKEYLALVFGMPDDKVIERLERGILYEGEWLRADSAGRAGKNQEYGEAGRDETWLRIILHEGKKRQIRHMCAALGHPVKRLIRVRIGPLKLGTLKVGDWRKLTRDEIAALRETKERNKVRSVKAPRNYKNLKPGSPSPRAERTDQRSSQTRGESPSARPDTSAPRGRRNDSRYGQKTRGPQEARPDSNAPRAGKNDKRYGQKTRGPGEARPDAPAPRGKGNVARAGKKFGNARKGAGSRAQTSKHGNPKSNFKNRRP